MEKEYAENVGEIERAEHRKLYSKYSLSTLYIQRALGALFIHVHIGHTEVLTSTSMLIIEL